MNYFVGAFHDGVIMHALSINKTIEEGGDITDGLAVAQKMWNQTFTGSLKINAEKLMKATLYLTLFILFFQICQFIMQ